MTLHKIFALLRRSQTLKSDACGHGTTPVTETQQTAQALPRLDRLEVHNAIVQHLEWCMLFNEHLGADPDAQPAPAALPDAQHSELGLWIARISQEPAGQHPLLAELAQENRRFHRLAQQALDFARSQRLDLASSLLNLEFERSRSRVLEILRSLQRHTQTAEPR